MADPALAYKLHLFDLEKKTRDLSLERSMKCWEEHSSKRKTAYNQCSKQATTLYHVFSDGRRRLKGKKRELHQVCEAQISAPDLLKECKNQAFTDLLTHVQSLSHKIDREMSQSVGEKTQ